MRLDKPSFPNGWRLLDGTRVLDRITRQQFVEVFRLDTGEYLYLFHDDTIATKLKVKEPSHEIFLVGGRKIIGKRYPDYKEGDIAEILKNLVKRRGLDAIAGMKALKETLNRDVIQPFLNWETYEQYGVSPSNGILLFGPPGCGKTFIANKLAEAIRAEMIELSEGSVGSPYIHDTSRNIAKAFRNAEQKAPCILFVDEISGMMPRRDMLASHEQYREAEINEFLINMEGSVKKRVLVIGATNFPERIDTAILRSGRMDKRVFIPPPDQEARYELFQLLLEDRPLSDDIEFNELAALTEGFVSSDLKLIVNNAALKALQGREMISMSLLVREASQFTPSLTQSDLDRYQSFETYQRS